MSRKTTLALTGLGLLLCILVSGWTSLSDRFVFGQGHSERPILTFLLLYMGIWVTFALATWLVFRQRTVKAIVPVLFFAVLARLLLLPSELIQENDVYRYVLDGQAVLHGENPYRWAPSEIACHAQLEFGKSLQTAEARLVLSRIGYPEIPTLYPPAAQAAFAAGVALGGWSWIGQRWVFLLLDLVVIGLGCSLLIRQQREPAQIILYAWNPLILKEITNSAHVDVLVCVTLLAVLLAFESYSRQRTWPWLGAAGIAFAMSLLTKLYPVVLAPAVLLAFWRLERRKRSIGFFIAAGGATFAAGLAPFLSVGLPQLVAGLQTYLVDWRMNEGAFLILSLLGTSARTVTYLLTLALALAIPLIRGRPRTADLAGDMAWVLLLWFLLLPAVYPWYAVAILALSALSRDLCLRRTTVALSAALSLYYLSFMAEYHDWPSHRWIWIRALEHGIIWATALGCLLLRGRTGSTRDHGRPV